MINDNASDSIIAQTNNIHKKYARLYFRPRTPTQWHNEGILCTDEVWDRAHCPVPVFFIFDLQRIFEEAGVVFTDGSAASPRCHVMTLPSEFRDMPFEDIYHEGAFPPSDRNRIVFARQAEILVPSPYPLERSLVRVVCRTHAERETLLYLTRARSAAAASSAAQLMKSVGGDHLFFNRKSRVISVTTDSTHALIDVRLHRQAAIEVELKTEAARLIGTMTSSRSGTHRVKFHRPQPGVLSVKVEGALAYQSRVAFEDELPF